MTAILPERARLVYVSTSGVYGDCGGAVVSEARPLRPGNARARRRVDAERQLVRVARQRGMHLIILRVPGIYAADRLPLARLKAERSTFNRKSMRAKKSHHVVTHGFSRSNSDDEIGVGILVGLNNDAVDL